MFILFKCNNKLLEPVIKGPQARHPVVTGAINSLMNNLKCKLTEENANQC